MKDVFKKHQICAILRDVPLNKTIDYAKAVVDGGITMFEVAINGADAYQQIEILLKEFGDKAIIGAGTVINLERCKKAKSAGAQFFLSPSTTVTVLEFCKENSIPLLPGVMTPTDVEVCISYGYNTMKLFPAGDLPLGYINSLKGPFNGTEYVAVGGIDSGNITNFLKAGFIGAGIGSSLIPKEYEITNQWDKATEYIKQIVEKVRKC